MNNFEKLEESSYQFLIYMMEDHETEYIHDFLVHSDIFFEKDIFYLNLESRLFSSIKGGRILSIISNPDIYKKYYRQFEEIGKILKAKLYEISGYVITNITFKPNLEKFQILENRYTPVNTHWEEINNYQNILIDQLRTATEPIHYQNIGNTCRTIMQKIAEIVFNPETHKAPADKDLSKGMFKNRLHAYIKTELAGKDYRELRDFSLSIINSAENSINIANALTHSLNADSFIAEFCVISTISAVNTINIINRK